jgi:hypothetical protein
MPVSYYGGGQRVSPLRRLSCGNAKLASPHLIALVNIWFVRLIVVPVLDALREEGRMLRHAAIPAEGGVAARLADRVALGMPTRTASGPGRSDPCPVRVPRYACSKTETGHRSLSETLGSPDRLRRLGAGCTLW